MSRAGARSPSARPSGARRSGGGGQTPGAGAAPRAAAAARAPSAGGWHAAVAAAVSGLGYELVDVERAGRGLLRVTIDRLPERLYPDPLGGAAQPGGAVTVDDCEAVTRQLQYVLEVEGLDYARLEVSSPGLDRPLRSEADFRRFAGQQVRLTLKAAMAGRRHFSGLLQPPPAGGSDAGAAGGGWTLVFADGREEKVLSFALDELREARLEPVVDFKGRRPAPASGAAGGGGAATPAAAQADGG